MERSENVPHLLLTEIELTRRRSKNMKIKDKQCENLHFFSTHAPRWYFSSGDKSILIFFIITSTKIAGECSARVKSRIFLSSTVQSGSSALTYAFMKLSGLRRFPPKKMNRISCKAQVPDWLRIQFGPANKPALVASMPIIFTVLA